MSNKITDPHATVESIVGPNGGYLQVGKRRYLHICVVDDAMCVCGENLWL